MTPLNSRSCRCTFNMCYEQVGISNARSYVGDVAVGLHHDGMSVDCVQLGRRKTCFIPYSNSFVIIIMIHGLTQCGLDSMDDSYRTIMNCCSRQYGTSPPVIDNVILSKHAVTLRAKHKRARLLFFLNCTFPPRVNFNRIDSRSRGPHAKDRVDIIIMCVSRAKKKFNVTINTNLRVLI